MKFQMPRIEDRRLLCITAEHVPQLLKACPTNRDKCALLVFVDTGARLQEVINMNWEDVDDDLVQAHKAHGPIDNILHRKYVSNSK